MGRSITRLEAEAEARKLGFGYLLRYEHLIGPNEEIEEVRWRLPGVAGGPKAVPNIPTKLHTRCATSANRLRMSRHGRPKSGADIHEFRTLRGTWFRLFEHKLGDGFKRNRRLA